MQRVLIVEDDLAMNEYIGDILSQTGFQVAAAYNGVTGLDAIRASAPHVVILDIFMPEKDGLEMLVELRRHSPKLPVLVISGRQHLLSGCSMSLAKQLGATDVLAKPFTPKELLNRVVPLTSGLADASPPPAAPSPETTFTRLCGRLTERLAR